MGRSAARLDLAAPCAANGLSFDAIRAAIPARCYERSIGMGMLFLALTFIVYGALTYLLYTAQSVAALIVFAVIRGLTIGPTFIVGHDACHDALTPSARWNRVLGQIAFLPSWHSFTAWRLRHNFIHHRHTQILELDSGYPPLLVGQYQRMAFWPRLTYRLSRTIPFAGLLYFPEWLHHHLLPSVASREEYKKAGRFFALDYALIMLWMGCELALFGGVFAHIGLVDASNFQPAVMLFFGLVVTQFFWNWQMGFVTFLHHFHPDVSWYPQADAPDAAERQLVSTVHMRFPLGLNWAMLNILEHTAHHISPQIPLYQLAHAQTALKDAYRSQVTQERISFSTVLKPFAICKLWDAERECWVSYPR